MTEYEDLDDLGGLANSLKAMSHRAQLRDFEVILQNGATAIEGLMGEVAALKADLLRERDARRVVDQALANALGQLKAANDPEGGAA